MIIVEEKWNIIKNSIKSKEKSKSLKLGIVFEKAKDFQEEYIIDILNTLEDLSFPVDYIRLPLNSNHGDIIEDLEKAAYIISELNGYGVIIDNFEDLSLNENLWDNIFDIYAAYKLKLCFNVSSKTRDLSKYFEIFDSTIRGVFKAYYEASERERKLGAKAFKEIEELGSYLAVISLTGLNSFGKKVSIFDIENTVNIPKLIKHSLKINNRVKFSLAYGIPFEKRLEEARSLKTFVMSLLEKQAFL